MTTTDITNWVRRLDDPLLAKERSLREIIGGKAASLVRVAGAGKRTPAAFVILPDACRAYWSHGRTWPETLAAQVVEHLHGLEFASGRTYGKVDRSNPLRLAVRSGAAVSMPGTLTTVLDVHDDIDRDTLVTSLQTTNLGRAITAVFESWNGKSAQAYRSAHGIDDRLGTAVVVQVMAEPSAAGVAFTRDPRSEASQATPVAPPVSDQGTSDAAEAKPRTLEVPGGAADAMIIEAVKGTAEELVAGTQTGNTWEVPRTGAISLDQPPSLLDAAQLASLRAECLEIEAAFGGPVDVEWGRDADGWIFFQVRPIRFPSRRKNSFWEKTQERLSVLREAGDDVLVRHNLAESLDNPTPLTWSIWERFASPSGGLGRLYRRLGFRPMLTDQSVLELVGGRVYASPRRLVALYGRDFPFQFDPSQLRHQPDVIDRAPTKLELDGLSPWFVLRLPRLALDLLRSSHRLKRLTRSAHRLYERRTLPRYESFLAHEAARDLDALSAHECGTTLLKRVEAVFEDFYPELLLPGTLGVTAFARLEKRVLQVLDPEEGRRLVNALWASMPQPTADERHDALVNLGTHRLPLEEFLERFGHCGSEEMELASPRWTEKSDEVERLAQGLAGTGVSQGAPERLDEAIRRSFADSGAASLADDAVRDYADAVRLIDFRESARSQFLRGYLLIRQAAEALATKRDNGKHIYDHTLTELVASEDGRPSAATMANRRHERELARTHSLPPVIDLTRPLSEQTRTSQAMLRGTTICPGGASGAVVHFDRASVIEGGAPCVLVCRHITPQILPLMAKSAAVVVDQASLLSHGAVLARELGIPVVAVPGATAALRNVRFVHVDADSGSVTCVEPPASFAVKSSSATVESPGEDVS